MFESVIFAYEGNVFINIKYVGFIINNKLSLVRFVCLVSLELPFKIKP